MFKKKIINLERAWYVSFIHTILNIICLKKKKNSDSFLNFPSIALPIIFWQIACTYYNYKEQNGTKINKYKKTTSSLTSKNKSYIIALTPLKNTYKLINK